MMIDEKGLNLWASRVAIKRERFVEAARNAQNLRITEQEAIENAFLPVQRGTVCARSAKFEIQKCCNYG